MRRNEPVAAALSWDWRYFIVMLGIWVFMPEARRLLDWLRGSFESVQVLSVLPLVAVTPLAIPFIGGGWRRLTFEMGSLAYLWMFAFTYGLLLGIGAGQSWSTEYTFLTFCIPLIAGLWLVGQDAPPEVSLARISEALLRLGAISSLYGIYQFVAPPPWDVLWLNNVGLASAGAPEPFSFRIFGTLNSQGPFAAFLAIVILMNLPRLRIHQPWSLAAVGVCIVALAFTLVRSAWLAAAVGLCAYVLLSSHRWRTLSTLLVLVALASSVEFGLSITFGNEHTTTRVIDRVNTLSDLEQDVSANERRGVIDLARERAAAQPAGEGLGVIGVGTKLTTNDQSGTVFDNGYLARFVELGYAGGLAYALVVFGAVALLLKRRWSTSSVEGTRREVLAIIASVQVALLGLDLSSDSHNGFLGVLFWIALGIIFARDDRKRVTDHAAVVGDHASRSWRYT